MSLFRKKRICCISDIHIGVHQNSSMWHDICLNWASWLAKQLKGKGIEDIMISGDFFHYRDEISVNTIHVASQVMDIWSDFNIVVLVGNHDAYYKERSDVNSLSLFKNSKDITVIDVVESIEQYGKKIAFAPWATSVDRIPSCDILFGHFEINSFRMAVGKVCDSGVQVESLLDKSPLIISGHFHLRDERVYESGKVLYLGNPFQMDFGDREATKGYYILDIESQNYEFYHNDMSPEHKKIRLSELIQHDGITEQVKTLFNRNIVRLIFDKNISPDEVDILLKVLISLGSLMMTVDYENTFNSLNFEGDTPGDLSGVDIVTAIKEFVDMLDIEDKETITKQTIDIYNQCK